jgi:hypothetical protein
MILLAVAVATLVAASAAFAARPTDRAATAAERHAMDTAVDAYWCTYLPHNLRPCTQWKVKIDVHRVSTKLPTWGLSQFDASGGPAPADPAKPEVGTFQNVFMHRVAGKWVVAGAFQSLVYSSCAAAAAGTHVPLVALQDLGLCDRLARDFG